MRWWSNIFFQQHHTNLQSPSKEIKVSDMMFLELKVKPFFSEEEKLHTTREGYHGGVGWVGQDLKLDIYRSSQNKLPFWNSLIIEPNKKRFLRKIDKKHDNAPWEGKDVLELTHHHPSTSLPYFTRYSRHREKINDWWQCNVHSQRRLQRSDAYSADKWGVLAHSQ